MGPFEKHVFVCTGGSTCPLDGSVEVHARLKDLVKKLGLSVKIRVNHSGCMDQCGNGPMVVVYPENVWYCRVKPDDAEEIFYQHLVGGRPVERLRYHPLQPGPNKTVCSRPSAGGSDPKGSIPQK
jgi:(2Fe-2S) ferredoxin